MNESKTKLTNFEISIFNLEIRDQILCAKSIWGSKSEI